MHSYNQELMSGVAAWLHLASSLTFVATRVGDWRIGYRVHNASCEQERQNDRSNNLTTRLHLATYVRARLEDDDLLGEQ